MSKFDLNDDRDHLAIQTRLDWICSTLRIHELDWVWEGAINKLEEDCGLSRGFINVKNFPEFLLGNYKLTIHDLKYRLLIENASKK